MRLRRRRRARLTDLFVSVEREKLRKTIGSFIPDSVSSGDHFAKIAGAS
jgi:hypothetical protein